MLGLKGINSGLSSKLGPSGQFIFAPKCILTIVNETMVQLNHFIESNNLYLKNSRVVILEKSQLLFNNSVRFQ